MLNFFSNELHKLVQEVYGNTDYVGRTCYIPLGNNLKLKIEFGKSERTANTYDNLLLTAFDINHGKVDQTVVYFSDVLKPRLPDTSPKHNPSIPLTTPSIVENGPTKITWDDCTPTEFDYQELRREILVYISTFTSVTSQRPCPCIRATTPGIYHPPMQFNKP